MTDYYKDTDSLTSCNECDCSDRLCELWHSSANTIQVHRVENILQVAFIMKVTKQSCVILIVLAYFLELSHALGIRGTRAHRKLLYTAEEEEKKEEERKSCTLLFLLILLLLFLLVSSYPLGPFSLSPSRDFLCLSHSSFAISFFFISIVQANRFTD